MKRYTIPVSIGLIILMVGSISTQAQTNGTLSDELTETKYGWELTTLNGDGGSFEEGDTIQYEFSEEPAGMTYQEYLDLGISIEANRDQVDLDAEVSTYSDLETLAVLWIFIWVVFDPETELIEENGYTVSGSEATDTYGFTYDTSSGIMVKYVVEEGSNKMVWKYREGGISGLPINPIFALFGLLAIPILRRKRSM